jgi:hypothetical protein
MSQALATPSPDTLIRRIHARVWEDPDVRSTTIGLLGVILIHLLLLLIAPHLARLEPVRAFTPVHPAREFSIEITPDMLPKPQPKTPPTPKQFVETNPDAPENTPDKTNNFAARNQQVAQEKPTPNGMSERPAMEGKKDFQSNQIVSGRLEKPTESMPMASATPTPPSPPSASVPRAEQNPLPGFTKAQGENADSFGSTNSTAQNNVRPIPERIEGMKDVPLVEGATGVQPAIDPKRPRQRPMLVKQQQVRPAILADNKFGTQNVGVTAINARFNEYGLYLQRLVDAVQLEFDRLVENGQTYPPVGSFVVVRFILDSEGKIPRIVSVDNHSSDTGARTCVSAITARAPYGPWSDDMKQTLNAEGEELVFTFYYQ